MCDFPTSANARTFYVGAFHKKEKDPFGSFSDFFDFSSIHCWQHLCELQKGRIVHCPCLIQ